MTLFILNIQGRECIPNFTVSFVVLLCPLQYTHALLWVNVGLAQTAQC
jgi:hypothetical protein